MSVHDRQFHFGGGIIECLRCIEHGRGAAPLLVRGTILAAIEPWYDWGKIGVERMESLRPGQTPTDGEVRYIELQWFGVHIAFQIGRTPKRRN